MSRLSYDFTGDKEAALMKLRKEFDEFAYPYFEEKEKQAVGTKGADGEHHLCYIAPSGLKYHGIMEVRGYEVRWFLSVSFSYASETEENDRGRCYALFFMYNITVLTFHSLRRYNERALHGFECNDADIIFHKYIERMMDYAKYSKSIHKKGPSLFVRVEGGAFLSDILMKENQWCKTFISDDIMYPSQTKLANAIDAIDQFESVSRISLSSIADPDYAERMDSWIGGNSQRMKEYLQVLQSVQIAYQYYTDDELGEKGKRVMQLLRDELKRFNVS